MPYDFISCVEARRVSGGVVNALSMSIAEFDMLQRTYRVGELLMPCCNGAAIPKVSPNGHPHFAHASGACSETEESQWHRTAKHAVRATLETLGCSATIEEPGKGAAGRWQADVWGERGDTRIAIEIQHSYQHLRDYRARQEKYRQAGIHCLWLLPHDRYVTLTTSMRKERQRTEFGGGWQFERHEGPCLSDIPVARLEFDETGNIKVTGGSFYVETLAATLDAVLTGRFLCVDGWWCIDNLDSMHERARLVREANQAKSAHNPQRRSSKREP